MDLIYMNKQKEDVGVVNDYTLDLAFGADENDFECQVVAGQYPCEEGYFLYYEGSEYGGIVDTIGSDTAADSVTYKGRTWHGMMASKVIEPLKDVDVNFLDCSELTEQTSAGIKWTPVFADDGRLLYIEANGTATANSAFFLKRYYDNLIDGESYTISGCPAGGGTGTWLFRVADDTNTSNIMASDYGEGRSFTYSKDSGEVRLYLRVSSGQTVSRLKFCPKIMLANEYSDVIVHENGQNFLPYPYYHTTQTTNSIEWVDNGNGTLSAKGTASGTSSFTCCSRLYGRPFYLPKGKYKLMGCPEGGSGSTYAIQIGYSNASGSYQLIGNSYEEGLVFEVTEAMKNLPLQVTCNIYTGTTVNGLLFQPTVLIATDTGGYKPYKSLLNEYLMLSGEANAVIGWILSRIGLSALFRASNSTSGINVSAYKMNRYINGYDGIRKMLKESGAKLKLVFKDGMVEVSAVPIVDYSKDEQFDQDKMAFKVTRNFHPINHVICLGKGELAEREVIHVYADASGKVSDTQIFTGIDEVTVTYENTNAESSEELKQGGVDMMKESWNANELDFDFSADDESFDIGDVVGAKERITGVEVQTEITKKIVKVSNNEINITYEVGD